MYLILKLIYYKNAKSPIICTNDGLIAVAIRYTSLTSINTNYKYAELHTS